MTEECPLSPTRYSTGLYMNHTARQWQNKLSSHFPIIRNKPDTIFADDQAMIAKTGDNLERARCIY
jgi:hypothetical protein